MSAVVFVPPDLAFSITRERWHHLLLCSGAPPALVALAPRADALGRALWGASVDDGLAATLDHLVWLACDAGALAVRECAAALGFDLGAYAGESPANLAAWLLGERARGERSAAAAALVACALFEVPRRGWSIDGYERLAAGPERARGVEHALVALLDWARVGGGWAEAWSHEGDDGRYHIALRRYGDAPSDRVGSRDRALPPSSERWFGVVTHVVRVDPAAGRLFIRTRSPEHVDAIAAITGRALFGDAAHFERRRAFTLKLLNEMGAEGLQAAALGPAVRRVRITACEWDTGGQHTVEHGGPHAIGAPDLPPRPPGGFMISATLRFDLAGEAEPVDAQVKLPGLFAVSAPRHESVVREALATLGVLSPGARPDDLFSLSPFEHPAWRWRDAYGEAEIAALEAAAVLSRVSARRAADPEARSLGPHLTSPIAGRPGQHLAVANDPSAPRRIVRDEERTLLRLSIAKLAERAQKRMRLEGEVRELLGGAAVEIGRLAGAAAALRFIAVVRSPGDAPQRSAFDRAMRIAAQPDGVVLVLPRGRSWGSAFVEVECGGLLDAGLAEVRAAVREAGMADEVPRWRLSEKELVLDAQKERAWLWGVELSLSDGAFKMLATLARSPGQPVSPRALGAAISPHADPDQIARRTRARFVAALAESLARAGREPPVQVEEVVLVAPRRGYWLAVEAELA